MATDKYHQCHPQRILSQTNYMNIWNSLFAGKAAAPWRWPSIPI
jgi:hypothetical protein